ncbi:MAG: hypothetical protein Edafosvirus1_74 [Edafosvirus sp.]|uniref:Uncharacterized protein n=1 Tax=Edafosvirus sp. TaxID=2487765 RepID=A0A3G4ZVU4_9VIRU|nr:MAG: hypothetical protein Edafosvirus1_74 [Edafosvirus sp.]
MPKYINIKNFNDLYGNMTDKLEFQIYEADNINMVYRHLFLNSSYNNTMAGFVEAYRTTFDEHFLSIRYSNDQNYTKKTFFEHYNIPKERIEQLCSVYDVYNDDIETKNKMKDELTDKEVEAFLIFLNQFWDGKIFGKIELLTDTIIKLPTR